MGRYSENTDEGSSKEKELYDPRCYDLAEAFLIDELRLNTEHHRQNLAQTLQHAIEDWIALNQDKGD